MSTSAGTVPVPRQPSLLMPAPCLSEIPLALVEAELLAFTPRHAVPPPSFCLPAFRFHPGTGALHRESPPRWVVHLKDQQQLPSLLLLAPARRCLGVFYPEESKLLREEMWFIAYLSCFFKAGLRHT